MAPDSTALSCVQFAQHAEALGAHSVWVPDRLLYRSPEALVTLAAIAAETSRVRLGINVRLGVSRPPVLLAKTLATLDVLSGGRLIVGLGVGSRSDDFAASHVPLRQRGRPVVILSPSASLRTSSAKDPRAGVRLSS